MSIFKPLSIATIAALSVAVSYQAANAANPTTSISTVAAPAAPMGLCQDQKNMAAALGSLRDAKASLEKAEHNKGGWRDAALTGVETAIAKTELGCAAAK